MTALADRELALKAVDAAFNEGIGRIYAVLVQGLMVYSNSEELTARFKRGLAFHCDGHGKATAAVIDYFQGEKP